jgi:hypothetical protein
MPATPIAQLLVAELAKSGRLEIAIKSERFPDSERSHEGEASGIYKGTKITDKRRRRSRRARSRQQAAFDVRASTAARSNSASISSSIMIWSRFVARVYEGDRRQPP